MADYEQTYHILNEIMKWSVLTGWMAEHDLVPDLNKTDIYRSHRFDEWYAKSVQLRFREDIPFTLKERWPNGNECLEQIRSYGFPKAGHPVAYVEGGVSLGSAESLRSTSRIRDDVPAQLRQGSLDYKQSTAGNVTTLKNTQFAFPEADKTVARVVATLSDKARIRNGPSELGIKTLTTQVGLEGNTRSVALISDQGSLGTLHSEVTADGVRLSWRSGVVANDEALVRTLAKSADLGSSSARNDLLAMRNLYVVIREDQAPQIVRMSGGNGKGPIDPGSASGGLDGLGDNQPRLFGFASSRSDSQSNAYLRFSDSPNWQLRLGLDEPPKAEAAILEGQHATETINRTKWQVLLALTDENGGG